MPALFDYQKFISRNSGYIDSDTQSRIQSTRLLFAGCGLGSGPVICAARTGFENFILIDGDVVEAHNLNRQFFDFDDVGALKVDALKKQILRINPAAQVEIHPIMLDTHNAAALVRPADVIFDTIDFVDLSAVLALHTQATVQDKPIFSALNAGFGACVSYYPPGGPSLPQLLEKDIAAAAADGDASYTAVFGRVMGRLNAHLDPQVVREVAKALTVMEDGVPCPASQIAAGSFAVAAMAVAMIHDVLAGLEVPAAPYLLAHSYRTHTTRMINMAG